MNLILLMIGAGAFVTMGDFALGLWARGNQYQMFIIGIILNIIGIGFYAQTLRLEAIGVATAIFLGLNILLVSIMSVFMFNENLNLRQMVGMVVLVLSIFVIEI